MSALANAAAPPLLYGKWLISPAQFKAMDSTGATEVVLLPAPGLGFAWVFTEANLLMPFSTGQLAYLTGTGNLMLRYAAGVGLAIPLLTSADIKTASRTWLTRLGAAANIGTLYPTDADARSGFGFNNASVGLNVSTAVQYTQGTTPFVFDGFYRLVSLA